MFAPLGEKGQIMTAINAVRFKVKAGREHRFYLVGVQVDPRASGETYLYPGSLRDPAM